MNKLREMCASKLPLDMIALLENCGGLGWATNIPGNRSVAKITYTNDAYAIRVRFNLSIKRCGSDYMLYLDDMLVCNHPAVQQLLLVQSDENWHPYRHKPDTLYHVLRLIQSMAKLLRHIDDE